MWLHLKVEHKPVALLGKKWGLWCICDEQNETSVFENKNLSQRKIKEMHWGLRKYTGTTVDNYIIIKISKV